MFSGREGLYTPKDRTILITLEIQGTTNLCFYQGLISLTMTGNTGRAWNRPQRCGEMGYPNDYVSRSSGRLPKLANQPCRVAKCCALAWRELQLQFTSNWTIQPPIMASKIAPIVFRTAARSARSARSAARPQIRALSTTASRPSESLMIVCHLTALLPSITAAPFTSIALCPAPGTSPLPCFPEPREQGKLTPSCNPRTAP